MDERPNPTPEPEIIPPGTPLPRRSAVWESTGILGARRVYAVELGPFRLALLALGVGVFGAIALVVLLGMAVVSLISAGLLALAFVIAGILRKANQPLR